MVKSFSKWSTYDQCPRKYKYRYKDRIPVIQTERNDAAQRGTRVHESVEHMLQGKREDVDEEIQEEFGEWLISLKNFDNIPELKFAIDKEFEVCDYDSPDCLVRGFIDLVVMPEVDGVPSVAGFEWKTGKLYDSHLAQKMLYGMVLLILYPDVKTTSITGVYFDHPKHNKKIVYSRSMLGTYKWMWLRRFDTMDADNVCAPNPSFLCKWCDYSKGNGGPCSF